MRNLTQRNIKTHLFSLKNYEKKNLSQWSIKSSIHPHRPFNPVHKGPHTLNGGPHGVPRYHLAHTRGCASCYDVPWLQCHDMGYELKELVEREYDVGRV